nr:hypothetical protein [Ideonella sp.]
MRSLLVTTAELQRVRGLNHRALNGDQGAVAPRDAARSRLQEHLRRVDGLLADTPDFTLEDQWPGVRDAIGALAAGRHDPMRLEAFRQHTEQVEALRQLVLAAAERSGLLLDPVAQTYFLMDMSVERVLPWTETLGLVRGEGAGLLARGDASSAERARVLGRIDQLDRQLADVQWRAGALERSGTPRSEAQGRALALSRDFANRARTVFSAEALEGEAQVYFDQGTQAIDAVLAYGDEVQGRLGEALLERVQQKTQALWLQGAVSLAGV